MPDLPEIDHRAEAERLLVLARQCCFDELAVCLARAQVHATLAAGAVPAGHPVVPYREALNKLREAVRAALAAGDEIAATGQRVISLDHALALLRLAGEA